MALLPWGRLPSTKSSQFVTTRLTVKLMKLIQKAMCLIVANYHLHIFCFLLGSLLAFDVNAQESEVVKDILRKMRINGKISFRIIVKDHEDQETNLFADLLAHHSSPLPTSKKVWFLSLHYDTMLHKQFIARYIT